MTMTHIVSKKLVHRKAGEIATLNREKLVYLANLCAKHEWVELLEGYVELIKKETPESNLTQAMSMYSNKFDVPYYIVKEAMK